MLESYNNKGGYMPTQEVHTSMLAYIGAILGGVISFVFEVPAPVVFAGFLGTLAGLGFSRSVGILSGLGLLSFGVMASGFATPMLITQFGAYSAKGVAFFTAFVLVGFRVPIAKALKKFIATKGGE